MLRKALFVILLILSLGTSAQEFVEDDGFFIRKGYNWSQGAAQHYYITVIDPVTSEELVLPRTTNDLPDTVNGLHVYTTGELKSTGPETKELRAYLLKALQPHVKQMWFSGKSTVRSVTIHLQDFIIDTSGRVVFFNLSNITGRGPDGRLRDFDYIRLRAVIGGIVDGALKLQPATLNQTPVIAYADLDLGKTEISFDGRDFHFKEVSADYTK